MTAKNHLISVGYLPLESYPDTSVKTGAEEITNCLEFVQDKLQNFNIHGVLVFGHSQAELFVLMIVEKSARELNDYLYAFFEDPQVSHIDNKLNVIVNVNPDKSYSIGVVPNPMITINRMDARHIDYEELTIVLGVPTMWSEKYEGSTIHTLKDTLTTHERLQFGYIDIGDAKRLVGEPNSTPQDADDEKIEDIYTVLGFNDFPKVDNVAYFENEVFPSSAMQHIQNILGSTLPESVKNVLVIS